MKQSLTKIKKPWGHELLFAHTKHYAGKILVIRKGESLSLQYHNTKEESIFVSKGKLRVVLNDQTHELVPGEALHIPPESRHRMEALEDTEVFEVSTPQLDDVVRLEDRYGRI